MAETELSEGAAFAGGNPDRAVFPWGIDWCAFLLQQVAWALLWVVTHVTKLSYMVAGCPWEESRGDCFLLCGMGPGVFLMSGSVV